MLAESASAPQPLAKNSTVTNVWNRPQWIKAVDSPVTATSLEIQRLKALVPKQCPLTKAGSRWTDSAKKLSAVVVGPSAAAALATTNTSLPPHARAASHNTHPSAPSHASGATAVVRLPKPKPKRTDAEEQADTSSTNEPCLSLTPKRTTSDAEPEQTGDNENDKQKHGDDADPMPHEVLSDAERQRFILWLQLWAGQGGNDAPNVSRQFYGAPGEYSYLGRMDGIQHDRST